MTFKLKYLSGFLFFALLWIIPNYGIGSTISLQQKKSDNYSYKSHLSLDTRSGQRINRALEEKIGSISEFRLQLDLSQEFSKFIVRTRGEFVSDTIVSSQKIEFRDFNIAFSPGDFLQIKAGKQILAWGTGDLVFINDLFPKDWNSFFIGRSEEYLKSPSNVLKSSFSSSSVNFDLIYSPYFNGSTYVDGTRLSYWNSIMGVTGDQDLIFYAQERNNFPEDSEYSFRIHGKIFNTETAFYFHNGFWKTPEGFNLKLMHGFYPRLSTYGFSLKHKVWGGTSNLEFAYYDSRQDRSGTNSSIRNSELRLLLGFARELGPDFTGAIQAYCEKMLKYNQYILSYHTVSEAKHEFRNMLTLRLTKLFFQQDLNISMFLYYSPSDVDVYIRPRISYKLTDKWIVEGGGNFFAGDDYHTFWGQYEDNSNIYFGFHYEFQ
jgi:hypothetical protein